MKVISIKNNNNTGFEVRQTSVWMLALLLLKALLLWEVAKYLWASDCSSPSQGIAEIKWAKHPAQHTARAQHTAAVTITYSQFHLLISNRDTNEQWKKSQTADRRQKRRNRPSNS